MSELAIAILACFVLAGAAPWIQQRAPRSAGWLLAALPALLTAGLGRWILPIARGETAQVAWAWVPELGLTLSLRLDGLSLLFGLLICGIGTLVLIYAGGYLSGNPLLGRFYSFLLLFMGAMLGLVLAGNLLTLFVFWELTSISSYLLIGFSHERAESRAAALQALLVTGAGGLALLAGLLLLGHAGGSFELVELLERGDTVRAHPLYLPILLLILAGCFTKSAQFPFHFWLPNAMAAPTPVSAYLHSATMVKAGIYLLARLSPVLGGTLIWQEILAVLGGLTMLMAAVLALYQTDMKRILAYSTLSALGTLTLLLGLGTPMAVKACIVFLMGHALYKGALFMVAGAVDHETGTREVDELAGLRQAMPVTAAIAVVAALSLAGAGPVVSFIGKELFLKAVWEVRDTRLLLLLATVLTGGLLVAVAGIISIRPFFGTPLRAPRQPHEAPLSLWLGPALLAGFSLALGALPELLAVDVVGPAVTAILGESAPIKLALWYGLTPALALTGISLATGALLYTRWEALHRAAAPWRPVLRWGPARGYELALTGLNRLARWQTRLLQNGSLRAYLTVILATIVVLAAMALLIRGGLGWPVEITPVYLHEAVLCALAFVAALAAVRMESRLAAISALGVTGFSLATLYLLFGAPDLAITQLLVETLAVLLFVLVFYHLPRFTARSSDASRRRDALLAAAVGALMTVLTLAASSRRLAEPISGYFAEQSVPGGYGRNIVNVILVDFRALDTLGEITVLSIAALGIYGLLKLRPRRGKAAPAEEGRP